jgi:tetratricopeptide (TPR) repeat protein
VADGQDLYAGTGMNQGVGTVLRSKDQGTSWVPLNKAGWPRAGRAASLYVNSIFIDGPKILAGTNSRGILVSRDAGETWAATESSTSGSIESIVSTGTRLYAAAHSCVLSSADGGISWTKSAAGLPKELINCLATIGQIVYAGTYQGLFRSEDDGATWRSVLGLPRELHVECLAAGRARIFAGAEGGLFRSDGRGETWTRANVPLPPNSSVSSLAVSGSLVFAYVSHGGVLMSSDDGETWSAINTGWDPERVIVGNFAVEGPYLIASSSSEVWRYALSRSSGPAAESAATHFQNGQRAYQSGDLESSVLHFSKAIELDPKLATAWLGRAWAYLALGGRSSYDLALADAAKVLELSPENKAVYFARGEAYRLKAYFLLDDGKKGEAETLLDKALADYRIALPAYPNSREIPISIGNVHFAKGDLDRALAEYGNVLDKNRNDPVIQERLQLLFREYIRRNREADCGGSVALNEMAAEFHMKEKQFGRTVRYASRLIELGRNGSHVYMLRSSAYRSLGELDKALADADAAVKISGDEATLKFRAYVHEDMGHWDLAVADYSKALKLMKHPSDSYKAGIYRHISEVYRKKGDTKKADSFAAKAEALAPSRKR